MNEKRFKQISLIIITLVIVAILIAKFYVIPYYQKVTLGKQLKERDPLFALLAERSPQAFDGFIDQVRNDIQEKKSTQDLVTYTGDFINEELSKYVQNATNISIYRYVLAMINFYEHLLQINPIYILNLEFANQFPTIDIEGIKQVSASHLAKLSAAKREIILSAIQTPQPALTAMERIQVEATIQNMMNALAMTYGKEAVQMTFKSPNTPTLDKKLAAEIVIQSYKSIAELGVAPAGMVFKYILSAKRS